MQKQIPLAEFEKTAKGEMFHNKVGYMEATSILSEYDLIQFFVPSLSWIELRESEEWKNFSKLLSEHQKKYIQMQHQELVDKGERNIFFHLL